MIKYETIHEMFAGPMGIILKERDTVRKKFVGKCHVSSLASFHDRPRIMEDGTTLSLNFFIINVCIPINLTT